MLIHGLPERLRPAGKRHSAEPVVLGRTSNSEGRPSFCFPRIGVGQQLRGLLSQPEETCDVPAEEKLPADPEPLVGKLPSNAAVFFPSAEETKTAGASSEKTTKPALLASIKQSSATLHSVKDGRTPKMGVQRPWKRAHKRSITKKRGRLSSPRHTRTPLHPGSALVPFRTIIKLKVIAWIYKMLHPASGEDSGSTCARTASGGSESGGDWASDKDSEDADGGEVCSWSFVAAPCMSLSARGSTIMLSSTPRETFISIMTYLSAPWCLSLPQTLPSCVHSLRNATFHTFWDSLRSDNRGILCAPGHHRRQCFTEVRALGDIITAASAAFSPLNAPFFSTPSPYRHRASSSSSSSSSSSWVRMAFTATFADCRAWTQCYPFIVRVVSNMLEGLDLLCFAANARQLHHRSCTRSLHLSDGLSCTFCPQSILPWADALCTGRVAVVPAFSVELPVLGDLAMTLLAALPFGAPLYFSSLVPSLLSRSYSRVSMACFTTFRDCRNEVEVPMACITVSGDCRNEVEVPMACIITFGDGRNEIQASSTHLAVRPNLFYRPYLHSILAHSERLLCDTHRRSMRNQYTATFEAQGDGEEVSGSLQSDASHAVLLPAAADSAKSHLAIAQSAGCAGTSLNGQSPMEVLAASAPVPVAVPLLSIAAEPASAGGQKATVTEEGYPPVFPILEEADDADKRSQTGINASLASALGSFGASDTQAVECTEKQKKGGGRGILIEKGAKTTVADSENPQQAGQLPSKKNRLFASSFFKQICRLRAPKKDANDEVNCLTASVGAVVHCSIRSLGSESKNPGESSCAAEPVEGFSGPEDEGKSPCVKPFARLRQGLANSKRHFAGLRKVRQFDIHTLLPHSSSCSEICKKAERRH